MRRISLRAWVSGAIIAAASLHSNAAGLGRLDVKSVLGEPLRAEVSVLAKPGELRSLKVRLASPQAYTAAGLIHTGIVSQLTVTLSKDAAGKPVVSISSAGPINEPVIDLLLELSWASGRVTREYTAFIDPPFIAAERDRQRVAEAVAAAEAANAARAAQTQAATAPVSPTAEPLPEESVADADAPQSAPTAQDDRAVPPQQTDLGPVVTIGGTAPTLFGAVPTLSSPGAPSAPDEVVYKAGKRIGVIRGDTLSALALANKPAGVTLEQMLVVLFRNNRDAFSGNNMNRLRTGKVIRLADPDEYEGVTVAEARKEVRVQSKNWRAYKERLAAATIKRAPSEDLPQQAAGGAVTPKVDEQAPAASGTSPEVVKLSRGESATAGQGAGPGDTTALQEKLIASEKALKDSNERVTRLEKIIEDLQKLAEVKSQDLAKLQAQAGSAAASKPTSEAPAKPAPSTPAQSTQPDKPQAASPAPSKPAAPTPTKPATPPETAQSQPAIQPSPDTAAPAKPEQAGQQAATAGQSGTQTPAQAPAAPAKPPAQAAQKPRRPPPPPPPPPPSLLDKAFAQPYLLAIPVVLLVLVGWGVTRLRGRFRESKQNGDEAAPAFSGSDDATATATATGAFAPGETDVGLAARGEDGDEVDPLEEAEIFLAYGRDAQAEELLQEAMAAHPTRYEIHVKLLEIYAKQNNVEAFEKLARDLQQHTGGAGDVWDRVVKLGYSIDPDNARYAAGAGDGSERAEARKPAADMSASTERLDFDVGDDDGAGGASSTGTDIDVTASREFEKTQVMDTPTMDVSSESAALGSDMNVDLPSLDHGSSALDLTVDEGGNEIDFDFDSDQIGDQPSTTDKTQDTGAASTGDGLDFDVNEMSFGSGADEETGSSDAPALDLSGISLDLDGATTNQTGASDKDDKWYEVQTKFDLAKAYQEMGDNDGAREILQEVVSEGDSDQKAAAESVLSSLD